MSAYTRIQWLHKKIESGCYPNSIHEVEKFGISQRQAQRDFEMLKNELGAPLKYSSAHRGYFYTEPFDLPTTNENNEAEYVDLVSTVEEQMRTDVNELQLRLPYTAQLRIKDKLTVMNLRRFILNREEKDVYNCEFYHIDNFLSLIFVSGSDITIIKPEWLREKLVEFATRVLKNNNEK
ncbi:MAG: hypothetical protein IKB02_06925 [Clostridia bacterium]|nr:hypothetical protein [Clostridia bacterium]